MPGLMPDANSICGEIRQRLVDCKQGGQARPMMGKEIMVQLLVQTR